MTDPPDSLDDADLLDDFVQAYAAGKHMAAWYIRLDTILEACQRYQPDPPAIPSQGDMEWLEDLEYEDPSES